MRTETIKGVKFEIKQVGKVSEVSIDCDNVDGGPNNIIVKKVGKGFEAFDANNTKRSLCRITLKTGMGGGYVKYADILNMFRENYNNSLPRLEKLKIDMVKNDFVKLVEETLSESFHIGKDQFIEKLSEKLKELEK